MNAEASKDSPKKSLGKRVVERVFPKVPDFFKLLGEQSAVVGVTAGFLVEYMGSSSAEVAKKITECEYEGDRLKVQNLTLLNEAFSTPIDREDIHRAIINLDEIINSCKTIVVEMDADLLGVKADKFCIEMAAYLKEGAEAIAAGYGKLGSDPKAGRADADKAEKAVKKFTKSYRRALAELFQDNDFHNIFRRKEIYTQLSHAALRMNVCNSTLLDIVVKLT